MPRWSAPPVLDVLATSAAAPGGARPHHPAWPRRRCWPTTRLPPPTATPAASGGRSGRRSRRLRRLLGPPDCSSTRATLLTELRTRPDGPVHSGLGWHRLVAFDAHFQLAIDAGCNAYAAPLGSLEAGAARFAGQVPLILKLNNSDTLAKVEQPVSAVTGSVEDALRLGCVGVGYTIYPGSGARNRMYEDLREIALEAKRRGLVVIVWSYPRGAGLSKQGETAIDVCAYAATIAAQLGAHIIKVKPPTAHIEQEEAKKMYEKYNIPIRTLADRTRHCRAGDVRRQSAW